MKFRTFSLIFTAVFNAIITLVGTYFWNYYAAAIATGTSIILGSIVMMNIYYHKRIGFKVLKFYSDVFHKLGICQIVPMIVIIILNRFIYGTWYTLISKIIVYIIVYFGILYAYGMNESEKRMFGSRFLSIKGT